MLVIAPTYRLSYSTAAMGIKNIYLQSSVNGTTFTELVVVAVLERDD